MSSVAPRGPRRITDPVLVAHNVRPGVFNLWGLAPISIRDQMNRAVLLVDRAVEACLIADSARPLLVDGAGVGGITAALRAVEHGVDTIVVEAAAKPFFRQADCETRWVDPAQYDWPATHWAEGEFPGLSRPPMPLPWRGDYADRLALGWLRSLQLAPVPWPTKFQVLYGTQWTRPASVRGSRQVRVTLLDANGTSTTMTFGMMLATRTFGTEDCSVGPAYTGYRFWDTDPLARPNAGLPRDVEPRILISGGGDGALQDCLRIVFRGMTADQLYTLLAPCFGAARGRVEATVRDAEDKAQRALSWGEHKGHDHPVLAALHAAHEAAVDALWQDAAVRDDIRRALRALIRPEPALTLAHSCGHFKECYALNRFLVMLLKRHAEDRGPGDPPSPIVFRPWTHVAAVDPADPTRHACQGNAADCYGVAHHVQFKLAYCPQAPVAPPPWIPPGDTFNVVVVRHGTNPPRGRLPTALRPRQLLPYHLPS
jgi:hypothetical protein